MGLYHGTTPKICSCSCVSKARKREQDLTYYNVEKYGFWMIVAIDEILYSISLGNFLTPCNSNI